MTILHVWSLRLGKKRNKGDQRRGVCVYCGSEGPITRDHVFPQGIFLVLDKEMITVPACESCQQIKSLGDRDLRVFSTIDVWGGQHPDAPIMLERILRKENVRFQNWIRKALNDAEDVDLVTDDGIIVGTITALNFNTDRTVIAQEMTGRGLFFHEYGVPLPVDCPVDVQHVPWNAAVALASGLDKAAPSPIRTRGNTTVWWKHNLMDGGTPTDTVWQVCYNDGVLFLISTGQTAVSIREKREAMQTKRQEQGQGVSGVRRQVVVPRGPDGRPIIPSQYPSH